MEYEEAESLIESWLDRSAGYLIMETKRDFDTDTPMGFYAAEEAIRAIRELRAAYKKIKNG